MNSSENSTGPTSGTGNPIKFRIFLASPGDVPLERKLAREAITHISSERRFRGRFDIDIIAWDQPGAAVAMEAGLTPQEAITQGLPKPEDCDLAVIILWLRIGTQLPENFELKEDGSPYLSGTEWEYLNALNGYKSNGKPVVWVYRRAGVPNPDLDDPDYDSIVEQWKKLKKFFAAFKNPDGSLAGGINSYQAPNDFRQQFEQHLRDRLDKQLESLPAANASQSGTIGQLVATPRWTESPYPGLEAYTPEQAPIFFGRGAEVDQLLQQFNDANIRFVSVVGVSGSGKSSLIKAGLLPRLRTGIIGNVPWIDLIIKPGERGGNPYLALAFALKAELEISTQSEQEFARALQADPSVVLNSLAKLLAEHEPAGELLLVIDQFEELFTQSTDQDRKDFLALLENIVSQQSTRVIVALRADFYARAIQEPTMGNLLRRPLSTFPLNPPGMSAILQMITRPAETAGLELQEGLAQRLLDDAGAGPGAMALIAFTLKQLYQRENNSDFLSIKDYEAFGGVQGAVQTRAISALNGLRINAAKVLPKLFTQLVEVNEQEVATRRRAPQSLLKGDVKTAADALIDAHLLVSGRGENDRPTLEVAHETVLTGWQTLKDWIQEHAEILRARRDLERVAAEWDKENQPGGALRTGKLLQRYLSAAEPRSPTAEAYLAACKRHRLNLRVSYTVFSLLVIVMLSMLSHVFNSNYGPALASKAMFVQWGLWPVPQPKFELISAGEFKMGDLSGEGSSDDERPVHSVQFTTAFEIGKYEVTFEEYDLFAAATGLEKIYDESWIYDGNKRRGKLPVINISWNDAVAYAAWLSELTGLKYRLPTEAEWEYAARAGTITPRYWSEKTEQEKEAACIYANASFYDCERRFKTTALVGSMAANDWGLHDMLGNVTEWTQDCYRDSYKGAPIDGSSRQSADCSRRVLRGGSWHNGPSFVRSAARNGNTPAYRNNGIGFRLARTP